MDPGVAVQRGGWLAILAASWIVVACDGSPPVPRVFAAASLDGLIEAVEPTAHCSYSASSTAARQVAAGAPADLLVVADPAWLVEAGERVGPATTIATNRLVLVAPVGTDLEVDLEGPAPAVARLAIGDPAHVPVGRYGAQALRALGWWAALEPRILPAHDARAALRLVALGEARLGVVYASDAVAEERVQVVAVLPERLHQPIRYVAAVVDDSAAGARLLRSLRGERGRRWLARAGLQPMVAADADSR